MRIQKLLTLNLVWCMFIGMHLSPKMVVATALEDEKITERNYTLYLHDESTGARCQDGSKAGLYYKPGFGDGADKVIIHFEGGGWCSGKDRESILDDCYDRTTTEVGTSNFWPEKDTISWVLSDTPELNIPFYNWNKFIFKYCDGSGH